MQHQLYMLRMGKKVYNITLPKTGRSCLVGMTSREGAHNLREYVSKNTPSFTISSQEAYAMFNGLEMAMMEIEEVDFQDTTFYKFMKLNNFALLVCQGFVAEGEEIAFDGELVDVEYPPDDEHRFYFDRLLNLPDPD